MRRTLLLLILFTILSGCNLGREDDSPTNTPDAATLDPGSRPEVTILSPEDGDEFLVDEPIIISVAVSGSNNITRVQLNANDETRVVAPESPDEDQYLLDYTPREDGRLDLTVIASSGVLQSEPETITVFVRQNQRQITATSSGGTNINPNDPTCRVLVNVGLNFRRGPSVDFEVIRVLAPGEVIPIVGRLGDNSWWQLSSGTSIGWVDARFVTTYGNCTGIAAVAPPATATPPSSATPIPTATSVVPTNTPIPTATPQPSDTPAPIMVYVTGAVNQPEITVSVPFGSRVSDVLAASGGVRDDADMTRVNLAAVVRDGDQIHVFSVSDSRVNNSPVPTHPGGKMIFINSATLEELDTLPGIGPTIAGRIIMGRFAIYKTLIM